MAGVPRKIFLRKVIASTKCTGKERRHAVKIAKDFIGPTIQFRNSLTKKRKIPGDSLIFQAMSSFCTQL